MSGVVEFLLARLDEDEASARSLRGQRHRAARVLADVAAKRRIVEMCVDDLESGSDEDGPLTSAARLGSDTIRTLATAYSLHPDYNKNWRP